MKKPIEQLSFFNEKEVEIDKEKMTSLPHSATVEWKNFYEAIADYAKRLKPTE